MNTETNKYIEIFWNEQRFNNAVVLLEASLGTGKTTQIEKIYNQRNKPKILYITSSTQLADQTARRFSFMTSYIEDDGKTRRSAENLRIDRLTINYHSLHKLSRDYQADYDVLIIDEPNELWPSTCLNKKQPPNYRNNNELEYRIRSTPLVVFMGGEIKKSIQDEIKTTVRKRPKALGKEITDLKHILPIDSHTRVTFVHNANDRNAFIGLQMEKRDIRRRYLDNIDEEEQEDDDWFSIDTGQEQDSAWELNEMSRRREEARERRENYLDTKGVLITTEYGEAVANIRETWIKKFPDLNIISINASNVNQYKDLLEKLSMKEEYSDIDMLILSPTWSTGINIENEFDLIVGDYARNTNTPLGDEQIYQSLHRERNPEHTVIHISIRDMLDEYISFMRDKADHSDMKNMKIRIKRDIEQLYCTRQEDGSIKPDLSNIKLYERALACMEDNLLGRTMRGSALWNRYKKGGADVEDWNKILEKMIDKDRLDWQRNYHNNPRYYKDKTAQRIQGLEPHDEMSRKMLKVATEQLGIEADSLTKDQWTQWDLGNVDENRRRNRELNDLPKLDKQALKRANLVNNIIDIFTRISTMTEERILTSEMVINTEIYNEIKENKEAYKELLQSFMTLDIPAMTLKEKDTELLMWLEEILRKYYFKVSYSKGGVKADYKKAKKEHNAPFERWKKAYKKELGIEGYQRYEDYLFIGLRDKTLEWKKLGKETKKYIKSFPHLRLTHYKEEIAPC